MKCSREIRTDRYDAIIIGAGMAGLVCATKLTQAGMKVIVLEQHFIPGGATSMFSRQGFRFEAGGHRVSGIQYPGGVLYDLFKSIGKDIAVHPLDPVYSVKSGDKILRASKDIKQYQENLTALFPAEKESINSFIRDMIRLNQSQKLIAASRGKIDFFDMLRNHRLFLQYSGKTTRQVISHYFSDEQLIMMATMLGVYTTLPVERQSFLNFANMWAVHHLGEGMSLIQGGTDALIGNLVDYITEKGGEVVVTQKVDRIIVEKNRATGIVTKDGHLIRAKVIVSAASSKQTYLELLAQTDLNSGLIRKIKNQVSSGSLFQLFLGVSEDNGAGLESTTTFVSPYPLTNPFQKIYDWDLDTITSMGVITVEGQGNAPEHYRSVNISCLIPYDHPDNWFLPVDGNTRKEEDRNQYNAFKLKLAEKTIQNMSRYFPDLKKRISVMETATPRTIERYTLSTRGGLQGIAHTREQSGQKRGSIVTSIQNLYHIGQDSFPGAGIVTVAISADICSKIILNRTN